MDQGSGRGLLPAHLRPSDDSSKTTQEKKSRKGQKRTENPGVQLTCVTPCRPLQLPAPSATLCVGGGMYSMHGPKQTSYRPPSHVGARFRARTTLSFDVTGRRPHQMPVSWGRCRCTVCLSSVSLGQGANACFCTGHAISSQRDAQGPQAHRCRAFPPAQHSPEVH